MRRLQRSIAIAAGLALLAACTAPVPKKPQRDPGEVRAQLVSLIPAKIKDREGWAADIEAAFAALELPPSTENLCAVLAVIEQESTYVADPPVPDLARIARAEIERRAAKYRIPKFAVDTALKLRSTDGRSYGERLDKVRTERELSELFEDLIGRVPLGEKLFDGINPVRTGGAMQVGIDYAERFAKARPYPYAGEAASIRHEVFTRRGGLYFGIAHLLKYPNGYERHLYRFADFNAGQYASRNAAFQAALTVATGVKLDLDGDLILHEGGVGATEAAARRLGPRFGSSDAAIRRALEKGDGHGFEQTDLYRQVFALAEAKTGKPLPRAVLPKIVLQSPKIQRRLTTEWFASRVQTRYQACVNRAFGR